MGDCQGAEDTHSHRDHPAAGPFGNRAVSTRNWQFDMALLDYLAAIELDPKTSY